MINAAHTTTLHNNYHMAENTHIPRRPSFGDHDDKDAIFIQSTRYPTRGQKATQCIKSTAMIMMPLVCGQGMLKARLSDPLDKSWLFINMTVAWG